MKDHTPKQEPLMERLANQSFLADIRTADEIFHANLPESLYLTHYELHERYPHIPKDEWRRFLQDNDRFIIKETALITEANARKALERLGSGKLASGDSTAISNLLKHSEQINQQAKDKTQYITMFLPNPQSRELKDYNRNAIFHQNRDNLSKFFEGDFLAERVRRNEVFLNADGTMHVLNHNTFSSALDKAYLALFNPENKKITELEGSDEKEWQ